MKPMQSRRRRPMMIWNLYCFHSLFALPSLPTFPFRLDTELQLLRLAWSNRLLAEFYAAYWYAEVLYASEFLPDSLSLTYSKTVPMLMSRACWLIEPLLPAEHLFLTGTPNCIWSCL